MTPMHLLIKAVGGNKTEGSHPNRDVTHGDEKPAGAMQHVEWRLVRRLGAKAPFWQKFYIKEKKHPEGKQPGEHRQLRALKTVLTGLLKKPHFPAGRMAAIRRLLKVVERLLRSNQQVSLDVARQILSTIRTIAGGTKSKKAGKKLPEPPAKKSLVVRTTWAQPEPDLVKSAPALEGGFTTAEVQSAVKRYGKDPGFSIAAIRRGMNVEREHSDVTKDSVKLMKIALAHLKEDPAYYKKLATVEKDLPAQTSGVSVSQP